MISPFGDRSSRQGNDPNSKSELPALVLQQMKQGVDKTTIIRHAIERGMDRTEAAQQVDIEYRKIAQRVRREMVTADAVQRGLLAGLTAAAIGAAAWGLVAIYARQELGLVALGIGFLCGYAVLWLSGRRKGYALQAIAASSALFAILAGKYIAFFHFYKAELADQMGDDFADRLSPLSLDALRVFFEKLPQLVGPYDLVWVLLAGWAAWSIPRGLGIRLPQEYLQPYFTGSGT